MSGSPHNPSRFPLDDSGIYDAYVMSRMCAAMAVGVRIGLFDLLDREALTSREVSDRLRLGRREVDALVSALSAMGLLTFGERDGESTRLLLSQDASAYLVRGKSGWLGGLIEMEIESGLTAERLLESVRKGAPVAYGAKETWEHHSCDPESARRFTRAMHSVSERPAAGLAEVIDFSGWSRMLDVGGGSGALSLAVARQWAHMECVVLDLPAVCSLATEYAEEQGQSDRVQVRPGDMFTDPFPGGFDVILFSQIFHDWPEARCEELLHRAHRALPEGGSVIVHEKLVGEGEDVGPLANALVNLDMLVWTQGHQYRESDLLRLFSRTGFGAVRAFSTAGYWTALVAERV